MPDTEEQRLDIIENCDILLNGVLHPFDKNDNSAEGRMVAQLHWLKERAENHDLPLPVERAKLSSLLYIYTNGEITHLASAREQIFDEIEIHMHRLIGLTKKAELLLKPRYYPYTVRYLNALRRLLQHPPRPLDVHERGLIDELDDMRTALEAGDIEPPLDVPVSVYRKGHQYPCYKDVEISRTLHDLPQGKLLISAVDDLIFNGVRPDTWLTPEAPDRETQSLLQKT